MTAPALRNAKTDDEKLPEANLTSNSGQEQLRSFVARMERLIEDRKAVNEDIAEVLNEAKGAGFDKSIIRKVVKIRSMDKRKREEEEALLDAYLAALGDLGGL